MADVSGDAVIPNMVVGRSDRSTEEKPQAEFDTLMKLMREMSQDARQETAASPEVAELREQLLDAAQERDVNQLRDLLPRAEQR